MGLVYCEFHCKIIQVGPFSWGVCDVRIWSCFFWNWLDFLEVTFPVSSLEGKDLTSGILRCELEKTAFAIYGLN